MLKYRYRLITALVAANVAAVCFIIQMAITLPMLRVVLNQKKTLLEYARELDQNKFMGLIPDSLIEMMPESVFQAAAILVSILVVVAVIGSLSKICSNYLAFVVSVNAVADIRITIFSRLVHLPLLTLLGEPISERVSRVMRDSAQLLRGFTSLMGRTMGDLLKGIAALAFAFVIDWKFSLLAMLMAPVLTVYYVIHGRKVRKLARKVLEQAARMMHAIDQSLRGLRVVKVHTAEKHEILRFRKVVKQFLNAEYPFRWRKSIASPMIEIITTIGFGALALYAAWGIGNNTADGTRVLVCVFALGYAATTLRQFTYVYNEIFEAAAAADRLYEIYEMVPEYVEDGLKEDIPRFSDTIEFRDIDFMYPTAHRPSLQGVSLKIACGSTVAFVGPNGSGKSTLLSLVPRLFDPSKGKVFIDGKDISKVSLTSLRAQIGVVTQETVLFHDTIANNIAYGRVDSSREEVQEVARRAYADEFICRKEKGYDTMVGDQGLTLSGGERQRLAIARAILRDPAILILDEATSMIDAESEALITEALDEFCHTRTSLVIAHRLSTVVNADRIVVLDQGKIIDIGTHQELLDRCVLYQQLCRTQLVTETGNDTVNEVEPTTNPQTSDKPITFNIKDLLASDDKDPDDI